MHTNNIIGTNAIIMSAIPSIAVRFKAIFYAFNTSVIAPITALMNKTRSTIGIKTNIKFSLSSMNVVLIAILKNDTQRHI
ncbi:unnamed protein product [marine sediment metagenome]|uniref:Uncharacterized protein n=1 Tax=marine sediment metagenome TaxID=412755 RepID=X1C4A3_9ZZZZ